MNELAAEVIGRGEIFDRILSFLPKGDLAKCMVVSRGVFMEVTKHMYHSVSGKVLTDLLKVKRLSVRMIAFFS